MSRGYHPRWSTTTPSPSMGSDLDEISQRSRLLRPSSKVHTVALFTPINQPPGTRGWHPPTLIEELPLPPWERVCWFCGLCGEWSESPIASCLMRVERSVYRPGRFVMRVAFCLVTTVYSLVAQPQALSWSCVLWSWSIPSYLVPHVRRAGCAALGAAPLVSRLRCAIHGDRSAGGAHGRLALGRRTTRCARATHARRRGPRARHTPRVSKHQKRHTVFISLRALKFSYIFQVYINYFRSRG